MVSKRKFYRNVIRFEILSEEPIPDCMTLEDIDYYVTEGHMSGKFLNTESSIKDGQQMAILLVTHGIDPEFFNLIMNGDDLEEE